MNYKTFSLVISMEQTTRTSVNYLTIFLTGADYENFRELFDDILDSESADLYISYNRENNTHTA